MAIRPSQRFLEGSMQTIEPDAERHFDRAAHGRCHVIHIDRQAHDEGVAQAAWSRFWIALAACQFHGRSSSIRLIGWLPIRSITSVNQADRKSVVEGTSG